MFFREGTDSKFMKKILFVANVAKEHILKFHIPTIRRFKEAGWQVDVACSSDDTVPYCDTQFDAYWKRTPFTLQTFRGIKQLKGILENEQYDIVYCHTPVGGLVARLAAKQARKNGTKVIYFAHGLHFFKGASLINWLIYYPIEKYLSRHTDVFFAINPEDYAFAKRHFHKGTQKVLTNGVGVNFERLNIENREASRQNIRKNLGLQDNDRVLVYIAELIKNKNQLMLLSMMKKLDNSVHLLLVGPDHDNGATKSAINRMGLADRVHLLGWRSDIGDILAASDIYVASSLREGFPINLLEAMYCHLPVVATKNRGHVTAITHEKTGLLVDIGDAEQMATYVKELLSDKARYDAFSNIDVTRYQCDRIADELYKQISSYC